MKLAVIDIRTERLLELLGPLLDAGVNIHCSLASDFFSRGHSEPWLDPFVRLVVDSPDLPDECERSPGSPIRRVRPLYSVQKYGEQRLTKIDRFLVDPDFRFLPPSSRFDA